MSEVLRLKSIHKSKYMDKGGLHSTMDSNIGSYRAALGLNLGSAFLSKEEVSFFFEIYRQHALLRVTVNRAKGLINRLYPFSTY